MKLKISFLLKCIVLVVVVYGVFTLSTMRKELSANQAEIQSISAAIADTQSENARLQESLVSVHTNEGVADIARDELGLVAPGEIIFKEAGK